MHNLGRYGDPLGSERVRFRRLGYAMNMVPPSLDQDVDRGVFAWTEKST